MISAIENPGARFAETVRTIIIALILAALAIGIYAAASAVIERGATLLKHLADRQASIAQLEERLAHEQNSLRDRLTAIGANVGELEQLSDPGYARQLLSKQQQYFTNAIADHTVAVLTPGAVVETPLNNRLSVYTATITVSDEPERVLKALSAIDATSLLINDVVFSASAGANGQITLTAMLTLQKIAARTLSAEDNDA